MNIPERLLEISNELKKLSDIDLSDVNKKLNAAHRIAESSSKSWIGYQSLVYYNDFEIPPAGVHYSIEWGFDNSSRMFGIGTKGTWIVYQLKQVLDRISLEAGNVNIDDVIEKCNEQAALLHDYQDELFSMVELGQIQEDKFVKKIIADIKEKNPVPQSYFIEYYRPKQLVSRDSQAMEGGYQTPPHYIVISACLSAKQTISIISDLSKLFKKLTDHLKLQKLAMNGDTMTPDRIFIGHGNSDVWREFKDFIQDRLKLSWDEFNRVPVAGNTSIERISNMLNHSSFAFLIMTAEDITPEGKKNARLNVIHEVGLFQGRLGFERAIILLEDGCEEFSNIHGLVQIRFVKGNIKSTFEEVRSTLEREGFLK
ncbi:MAG: nucleotide-binding protein [Candidatus Cloacimonetes bacterium]|nr:nucleotide-binding protein [Candidatus Cloacimonadota bacterium]